ncbi:MAG: diguanylate cyclase [Acidimicrobiales bacterium]
MSRAILRAEVTEFEATHDRLTGLFNRSGVVEWLNAQRPDRGDSMAICHLDLDRFQEINDVLGHEIGDQVICEVGRRLDASTGRTIWSVGSTATRFVVVFADVEG